MPRQAENLGGERESEGELWDGRRKNWVRCVSGEETTGRADEISEGGSGGLLKLIALIITPILITNGPSITTFLPLLWLVRAPPPSDRESDGPATPPTVGKVRGGCRERPAVRWASGGGRGPHLVRDGRDEPVARWGRRVQRATRATTAAYVQGRAREAGRTRAGRAGRTTPRCRWAGPGGSWPHGAETGGGAAR